MNTTPVNSITRIGRLILNDVMLEGRGLLVAAASVTGVTLLLFGVLPAQTGPEPFTSFVFPWVLLLGGCIYTSGALTSLHRRDRAIDVLMLPATTAEKLICRLLQTAVLYTLAAVVLCVIISLLVSAVRLLFGRGVAPVFNPLTTDVLRTVAVYVVVQAAFLCGSVCFRSRPFVKTVLVAAAFALLTALYVSLLGRALIGDLHAIDFSHLQALADTDWASWARAGKGAAAVTWYASAPLFWAVTYLRMREVEA